MHKSYYRVIIVSSFVAMLSFPAKADPSEQTIKFYTHSTEGASFEDKDGYRRGIPHKGRRAIEAEIVYAIMDRINDKQPVIEIPLTRALYTVTTSPDTAMFNVLRTPDREKQYKWVGPINNDTSYYYENKNFKTNIKNFDDVKNVDSVCTLRGSAHYKYLLKNKIPNMFVTNGDGDCLKVLSRGRTSLIVLSAKTVPVPKPVLTQDIVNTGVVLFSYGGYIAFSPDTPDEIINKWQNAFDNLKKEGMIIKIIDEFSIEQ